MESIHSSDCNNEESDYEINIPNRGAIKTSMVESNVEESCNLTRWSKIEERKS